MAIIQNGSPLFAGDAGSGPSNIRQYILENDWLDAIVQLSTDQFMNTGISTYIWVLCKDKPAYRCGKVQLIDASHCYEQRRKALSLIHIFLHEWTRRWMKYPLHAAKSAISSEAVPILRRGSN